MNNNKTDSQQKLERRLHKMVQKDGQDVWHALLEVIGFYQFWAGFCECGRMPITMNVHKSNYMYCKECRTYWLAGGNVITTWRDEDESVWRENAKLLEQARPIKSKHLYLSTGLHQTMLMTHDEMQQAVRRDYSDWGGREEKADHTETNTERNARMIAEFLGSLPNCPPELQQ